MLGGEAIQSLTGEQSSGAKRPSKIDTSECSGAMLFFVVLLQFNFLFEILNFYELGSRYKFFCKKN